MIVDFLNDFLLLLLGFSSLPKASYQKKDEKLGDLA